MRLYLRKAELESWTPNELLCWLRNADRFLAAPITAELERRRCETDIELLRKGGS